MILKIKNIVIGGNLKALQFALKKGYPILYRELELPFDFDYIDDTLSKRDYLEYMAFLLSLAGLNFYGDKIENISFENDLIKITGKRAWTEYIKAEKVHDFTINPQTYSGIYQVIDWIDIKSIGSFDLRHIDDEDDFVKKIIFYPSLRQNKSKLFYDSNYDFSQIPKDLVALSFLTKEQLEDESYSEIYSRLKTLDLLKKNGLKGKKAGFSLSGKQVTAPIKLEFSKREIKYFDDSHIYTDLTSDNHYVRTIIKYTSKKWKKI